jgi:hypothetical protein
MLSKWGLDTTECRRVGKVAELSSRRIQTIDLLASRTRADEFIGREFRVRKGGQLSAAVLRLAILKFDFEHLAFELSLESFEMPKLQHKHIHLSCDLREFRGLDDDQGEQQNKKYVGMKKLQRPVLPERVLLLDRFFSGVVLTRSAVH